MCGDSMRARWFLVLVMMAAGMVCGPGAALGQEELGRALARVGPLVGESTLYSRKGKEDIYDIARRYGVSASDLFNANGGELPLGDELLLIPMEHVAPVPWAEGVVVNLAERALYVYEQGRPVKRFPVAIGMVGWETPTGDFTIANMAENPTWFPPEWAVAEEPVPPGPSNPLGDRWMGLSLRGYGIHATNAPWSVGRYLSHGCMRMYPEHAHDLFEMVRVGTPVKIVYAQVVFGVRPGEGIVYMARYPDGYRLGRVSAERVREQLKEYGLDGVVDMEAVEGALELPRGLPTPIIGSATKVTVNGRRVKLALGPTRMGGDWLVPAGPLVEALGAEMEVGPGGSYVAIRRGENRLFFSPGDADVLINGQLVRVGAGPQMAAGHPMIPLKATAMGLGASVGWDDWTDTVLVWDGWGLGRLGRGAGVVGR